MPGSFMVAVCCPQFNTTTLSLTFTEKHEHGNATGKQRKNQQVAQPLRELTGWASTSSCDVSSSETNEVIVIAIAPMGVTGISPLLLS